MNNYTYENIVIGTGISSLGAIMSLVKKKKNILVIDSPNIIRTNENETIFCDQNLPINKINNWKRLNIKKILSIKGYGGHSNVWGGSCLRLANNEFDNWPIKYDELKIYYDKCEKFLKINKLSNQYEKFLHFKNNYKDRQIFYEKALIAKSFKNKKNTFNTKEVIDDLIKKKKILILRKNVKKIDKIGNKQYLRLIETNKKIFFKNLFIGAGPINTSKIIKNSIKYKKLSAIKQSQSFFVPAIMIKKMNNLNSNSSHQIIIKKFFKNIRNLHIELKYSPNYLIRTIKKRFGILSFLIPKFISERIIILSGFIPSDDSIDFVEGKINQNQEKKINKMKIKLSYIFEKLNREFSIKVVLNLIKFTQFGRSFHIGGNIPMSDNNDTLNLTTDKNGKLKNKDFNNIFIVDSSIFPSIPSGVLGLTSMANAYRIVDKKFL